MMQYVDRTLKLHVNGLKVIDKSVTNIAINQNSKNLKFGKSSNTDSFYLRMFFYWSFNGFLSDAFIRERAIYPLQQSSYSLAESRHRFPRHPYQSNLAAMFWLDNDMV